MLGKKPFVILLLDDFTVVEKLKRSLMICLVLFLGRFCVFKNPFLVPFWSIWSHFDQFLVPFWSYLDTFGPILINFWSHLVPFWSCLVPFLTLSGPFLIHFWREKSKQNLEARSQMLQNETFCLIFKHYELDLSVGKSFMCPTVGFITEYYRLYFYLLLRPWSYDFLIITFVGKVRVQRMSLFVLHHVTELLILQLKCICLWLTMLENHLICLIWIFEFWQFP